MGSSHRHRSIVLVLMMSSSLAGTGCVASQTAQYRRHLNRIVAQDADGDPVVMQAFGLDETTDQRFVSVDSSGDEPTR